MSSGKGVNKAWGVAVSSVLADGWEPRYHALMVQRGRFAAAGMILRQSVEPVIGVVVFLFAVASSRSSVALADVMVWVLMLSALVLLPVFPRVALALGAGYFVAWKVVGDSTPVMVIGGAVIVHNWFAHNRPGRIPLAIAYPVMTLAVWVDSTSLQFFLANAVFFFGLSAVAVAAGIVTRGRLAREERIRAEGEQATRRIRLLTASELHDSVAQTQSLVVMRLQELAEHPLLHRELTPQVSELLDMANGATKELRSAMSALRDVDKEFGAVGQSRDVESLAQQWHQFESVLREGGFEPRGGLDVGNVALPRPLDHAASRILGELVANIIWHGNPGPCLMHGVVKGGKLFLRVSNDVAGTGAPRKESGGQGISGIESRVAELGGTCSFSSENGQWLAEVILPIR